VFADAMGRSSDGRAFPAALGEASGWSRTVAESAEHDDLGGMARASGGPPGRSHQRTSVDNDPSSVAHRLAGEGGRGPSPMRLGRGERPPTAENTPQWVTTATCDKLRIGFRCCHSSGGHQPGTLVEPAVLLRVVASFA